MNNVVFVLFSVAVAAFVGGMTNYFAIKMLFHPRKPLYIKGYKLPFTPGLIPKRKDEIGDSLGRVVADYLVTSEGLANTLGKAQFHDRLTEKLQNFIIEWTSKDETIEQLILSFQSEEQLHTWKNKLAIWIRDAVRRGGTTLWDRHQLSDIRLHEFVPGWYGGKRDELVQWAVRFLVEGIKDEINSPQGERMLRNIVMQMLDQAGGLFGTLAGIFMDEDKMVIKVKIALSRQLESPSIQQVLARFIESKIEQFAMMSITDVLQMIVEEQDPRDWAMDRIDHWLPVEGWLDEWLDRRISDLFISRQDWLLEKTPQAVNFVIGLLVKHADKMIAAIDLPALVNREVSRFPIERIEDIILSVSGKEFRAITWLGVLLGGMIGLMQSFFVLLFR